MAAASSSHDDGKGGASKLQDSRICTVIGRKIGLPSIPPDASLYSTARAWLRDDPAALAAEQASRLSRCTPKRQRAPEQGTSEQQGSTTDVDTPPLPKRIALARPQPVPRAVSDGMLNSATDMPTRMLLWSHLAYWREVRRWWIAYYKQRASRFHERLAHRGIIAIGQYAAAEAKAEAEALARAQAQAITHVQTQLQTNLQPQGISSTATHTLAQAAAPPWPPLGSARMGTETTMAETKTHTPQAATGIATVTGTDAGAEAGLEAEARTRTESEVDTETSAGAGAGPASSLALHLSPSDSHVLIA